jgi:hypothetical protein
MNNNYPITGVIYSKPVEIKQGKKDPTKTYEFRSVVLEVDTVKEIERMVDGVPKKSRITKKELCKLDLAPWVSIDDFDIGNTVEIDFFLEGSLWKNQKGEEVVFTKAKATYIKLISRNAVPHAKKDDGGVTAPLTPEERRDDNFDDDNLPF